MEACRVDARNSKRAMMQVRQSPEFQSQSGDTNRLVDTSTRTNDIRTSKLFARNVEHTL